MASVNNTVRKLIERFPCAYDNRTEVLHQILVVLGAGYEWRDGQVVSRFPDDVTCVGMHQRFKYPEEHVVQLRELGIEVEERFVTGECPAEALRVQAAELAMTPGVLRHGVYPPCLSVPVLNVPADAALDWAEAAAEIAAVIGPLWAAGADRVSHEGNEDDFASRDRAVALQRLKAVYGPAVLGSTV
ncbi:hypothetical protein ABZ502_17855 [Streptomyces abikoensis]|uniref:hypothetical protein n=1 Tax=Streptomyces abikoensis TaxID=97398 RepID=UPI0033C03076